MSRWWRGGGVRVGMEGRAGVLSALLRSPVLSWCGESPAEGRVEWEDGEAEVWKRLWGASH